MTAMLPYAEYKDLWHAGTAEARREARRLRLCGYEDAVAVRVEIYYREAHYFENRFLWTVRLSPPHTPTARYLREDGSIR